MIFRARELYTMTAFANRYTKSRIHFAIGLTVLVRVFEDRYKDLPGTLLEGIARLFTQNVRLIVFPMAAEEVQKRSAGAKLSGWAWNETDSIVTADNFHPSGPLDSLYKYLLSSEFILPVKPSQRKFRLVVGDQTRLIAPTCSLLRLISHFSGSYAPIRDKSCAANPVAWILS